MKWITQRKAKCKHHRHLNGRKQGYSRLKRSSHGLWLIGWNCYSLSRESALGKHKILELLFWCRPNEKYKEESLKKTRKFPKSFKISGGMSGKDQWRFTTLNCTWVSSDHWEPCLQHCRHCLHPRPADGPEIPDPLGRRENHPTGGAKEKTVRLQSRA